MKVKAAQRFSEQVEIMHLSKADQLRFAEALLSPPSPSAALKRAMVRHDELFGAKEPSAFSSGEIPKSVDTGT